MFQECHGQGEATVSALVVGSGNIPLAEGSMSPLPCLSCGDESVWTSTYVVIQGRFFANAWRLQVCDQDYEILLTMLSSGSAASATLPRGRQLRLPVKLAG